MKKKRRIKKSVFLLVLAVTSLLLSICASADDAPLVIPESYYDMLDKLPENSDELLPEGMYSDDVENISEAIKEFLAPDKIFSMISQTLSLGIKEAGGTLISICGVILICSLIKKLDVNFGNSGEFNAAKICSMAAIFFISAKTQYSHANEIGAFFSDLNSLMDTMIPMMGVILATGGNIATAGSTSAVFYYFLALSERFCAASVMPLSGVCMTSALCGGFFSETKLGNITSAIKKSYNFILGAIMTVLLTILAGSTVLSSASDGIAAKSAKMVASGMIPVVGGAIGDTLRTVGASVVYIKSIVGIGAVIFIVILLLPPLVSLIVTRTVFLITSALADMLGCESESRFLGEIGNAFGILIAVAAMTSVMFIFAICIFINVSVATA